MERVVIEWKDGSEDTFDVVYNYEKQQVVFSSMPNHGAQRERLVKFHSLDGKDSFGILVRQGAFDTNRKTEGAPVCFGSMEGVDLRCLVFLDKDGNPFEVNFIPVEYEERN